MLSKSILIFSFFFILFSISAQSIDFVIPDRIIEGPYLEFTETGVNIYTWVKKEGKRSNKTGVFITGKRDVTVNTLLINRYDKNNQLLKEEIHSVKMRDDVFGMYLVCERKKSIIICDEERAFASSDDLTYRKLLKKFPASIGSKQKDDNISEEALKHFDVKLLGKGMANLKPPFTLVVNESEIEGKNIEAIGELEVPVKDIDTGDDNMSWHFDTYRHSEIFVNPQNGSSMIQFCKKIKKDKTKKWNYLQEKKFITFDKDGNQTSEKDIFFEKPMYDDFRRIIYGPDGELSGYCVIYMEATGVGKKVNPNRNPNRMVLVMFNENGEYQDQFEMEYPYKRSMLNYINFPGVFKTEQGYKAYLTIFKNKKEKIENSIYSFDLIDGKATKTEEYLYSDIKKSSVKGFILTNSIVNLGVYDASHRFLNGNSMYYKTEEGYNKDKKQTTYPSASFLMLSPDQNPVSLGTISRELKKVSDKPTYEFYNISEDKTLILIKGKGTNITPWLFNPNTSKFQYIQSKTPKLSVISMTMNMENDFFIIGNKNKKPTHFVMEKIVFE